VLVMSAAPSTGGKPGEGRQAGGPLAREGSLTSHDCCNISPLGSTSLTPLSGAGLCEAVTQMPVICCVFIARAAMSRPHLLGEGVPRSSISWILTTCTQL
jgi:hypothetical protein